MTEVGKVRLGVIGAGWFVSRRHLPDAMKIEEVEIAALCRRDDAARNAMCAHFGVAEEHGFADWGRMLKESSLDAVLIATPNSQHYEQAKASLEAGLHVLIEKPMTLRGDHARELVALAKEKNLTLSVALNPPFWAHCHRMRRAVQEGKLGEIESVSLFWSGSASHLFGKVARPSALPGVVPPTDYRGDAVLNGGGYFADGGPHLVSTILWVSGLRATRITALMDETPADMRSTIAIELENGAVATINAIGNSAFEARRVRNVFGGSGGTMTVDGFDFDTQILIPGQENLRFKEGDLLPVDTPLGNFSKAILHKAELYSPAEHGAHVVEVTEAIYKSASTGRTVTLRDER